MFVSNILIFEEKTHADCAVHILGNHLFFTKKYSGKYMKLRKNKRCKYNVFGVFQLKTLKMWLVFVSLRLDTDVPGNLKFFLIDFIISQLYNFSLFLNERFIYWLFLRYYITG